MKLITDKEYERIKKLLPRKKGDPGRSGIDNKLFVEGVIYVIKTGIPWRYLPKEYGKWYNVWQRFNRWSNKGIWDKIFDELKSSSQETIAIDSTSIKVHQEGMRYKKSCSQVYKFLVQLTPLKWSKLYNKIGKSRGGNTTKIHTATDDIGIPIRLILSEGNRNDIKFADKLIEGLNVDTVIADKGYDANWFRSLITNPVIPCRKNRKVQIEYDKELYKKRNIVERFFLKIKAYRKIATRYEQKARNFLSLVLLLSSIVIMRFHSVYALQRTSTFKHRIITILVANFTIDR